jgi:Flp pilus assembly protein TadB
MSGPLQLAAAGATGLVAAFLVGSVVRPPARLAERVRPYHHAVRTPLGALSPTEVATTGRAFVEVFRPLLGGLASRLGRVLDGGEEATLLAIRQAGLYRHLPERARLEAHRLRQLANLLAFTVGCGAVASVIGLSTSRLFLVTACGAVAGATRQKGRLRAAVEDRRELMRMEIYTVNQLLAMRVRAGGGVIHAVQQLVARGRGEVTEELREAIRLHRAGMPAAEAFKWLARITPEPHCARTYSVLAAAEERGADLGTALLALAEDVRETRREAIRRAATKRRAAMLVPTIAILAPVMLLFVAAPLPQLILNWR